MQVEDEVDPAEQGTPRWTSQVGGPGGRSGGGRGRSAAQGSPRVVQVEDEVDPAEQGTPRWTSRWVAQAGVQVEGEVDRRHRDRRGSCRWRTRSVSRWVAKADAAEQVMDEVVEQDGRGGRAGGGRGHNAPPTIAVARRSAGSRCSDTASIGLNVDTFPGPGDGRGGQLLEVAPARTAPVVELMAIMVTLPHAAVIAAGGDDRACQGRDITRIAKRASLTVPLIRESADGTPSQYPTD